MEREEWTPWIGIQDIFTYLRKRAGWGALCWLVFLALVLLFQSAQRPLWGGSHRFQIFAALIGGLATGQVMAEGLEAAHQWGGWFPYLLTTVLIMLFLAAITLAVHLVNPFLPSTLRTLALAGGAGVLARRSAGWGYWGRR